MYAELYQYLLQHKKLPVPGIGTFLLNRQPAVSDFPNRQIHAPSYSISLSSDVLPVSTQLYSWLGAVAGTTSRDAVVRFNDFSFDLKNKINDGDEIDWTGVGTLSKGLAGDVKFIPHTPSVIEEPVTAEKVIREKAEHMVRVGEEQKTSEEMTALLTKEESSKSYWWVWAAAIALLALLFIGWHFSEHGLDVDAVGNGAKLIPLETPKIPL
jgi:hypothetical protein